MSQLTENQLQTMLYSNLKSRDSFIYANSIRTYFSSSNYSYKDVVSAMKRCRVDKFQLRVSVFCEECGELVIDASYNELDLTTKACSCGNIISLREDNESDFIFYFVNSSLARKPKEVCLSLDGMLETLNKMSKDDNLEKTYKAAALKAFNYLDKKLG